MIRAAALALLFAAAPAAAQERSVTALGGASIRELAAHPEVAGVFRSVVRGRQGVVFAALSSPAALPVEVTDGRYVHARACVPEGCGRAGLVLGWDAEASRLYLLVVEDGAPTLIVPPGTPWPAAFAPGVAALRGGG